MRKLSKPIVASLVAAVSVCPLTISAFAVANADVISNVSVETTDTTESVEVTDITGSDETIDTTESDETIDTTEVTLPVETVGSVVDKSLTYAEGTWREACSKADVNMDKKVDILDIVAFTKYLHGLASPANYNFGLADVNGDGELDIFDLGILKYYAIGQTQDNVEIPNVEIPTEKTTEEQKTISITEKVPKVSTAGYVETFYNLPSTDKTPYYILTEDPLSTDVGLIPINTFMNNVVRLDGDKNTVAKMSVVPDEYWVNLYKSMPGLKDGKISIAYKETNDPNDLNFCLVLHAGEKDNFAKYETMYDINVDLLVVSELVSELTNGRYCEQFDNMNLRIISMPYDSTSKTWVQKGESKIKIKYNGEYSPLEFFSAIGNLMDSDNLDELITNMDSKVKVTNAKEDWFSTDQISFAYGKPYSTKYLAMHFEDCEDGKTPYKFSYQLENIYQDNVDSDLNRRTTIVVPFGNMSMQLASNTLGYVKYRKQIEDIYNMVEDYRIKFKDPTQDETSEVLKNITNYVLELKNSGTNAADGLLTDNRSKAIIFLDDINAASGGNSGIALMIDLKEHLIYTTVYDCTGPSGANYLCDLDGFEPIEGFNTDKHGFSMYNESRRYRKLLCDLIESSHINDLETVEEKDEALKDIIDEANKEFRGRCKDQLGDLIDFYITDAEDLIYSDRGSLTSFGFLGIIW